MRQTISSTYHGIRRQFLNRLAIVKNKNTVKEFDAEGSLNQFIDYPANKTYTTDMYYVAIEYQVFARDYTSAV